MLRRNFLKNLFGLGMGLAVAPKLLVAAAEAPLTMIGIDPGNGGIVGIIRNQAMTLKYVGDKGMAFCDLNEPGAMIFSPRTAEMMMTWKPINP